MNDPIFENSFTLTKSLYYEGFTRLYLEKRKKSLMILSAVLVILWLALAAWSVFTGGGLIPALPELIILLLVLAWAAFFLPRTLAKRGWKGEEERKISFYEDSLNVLSDTREADFGYGELKGLLKTKRLLILITESGAGIMLLKNDETEKRVKNILEARKND